MAIAIAIRDSMVYTAVYIRQEGSNMPRTAKLFRNGRSQAVRLPAEFRFEGKEVFIRRDEKTGDVILSSRPRSWKQFFKLRDEAIKADKRAFDEFLADRKDEPPQDRELF
ncbi:MAG TPA: AbrB/MazE/SpoVT family DNA-binding domain-containing protein [Candidatus Sulfotelmatobacter sp.]|nr:AbrB/MazE/SpoVT family DNA-binding domain-containing protein [Candidatus Sulfotelmatobacter sp.]